ncbi:uncharacterized protein HGUI_00214 [Hanseniaspora guilliermondii]|uniref:Uncharacterized protein n=1 Tax=Hanseniaspora guilliermondii TaxID=56406 RepID=A0A1L0FEJ4_9ASCO|nr:uncharacterized protein HGUI_00214 [Hanseniaspora guilliermondii]
MVHDENDMPMSQDSNQKVQKLPIYSNETKILNLLGQTQVSDQKNNRYVQNLNCSGCIDVDCDYIYKIEKFTKLSTKLSKNIKQEIFIDTLFVYFKNHDITCKTKEHALNFLQHYKNRCDESSKFTSLSETTAYFFFKMINKEDVFNIIKNDSKKVFVPNILEMGNDQKLSILCCNCRFQTFVNTILMRTTSTLPSSIAMHTCENGSQEISTKRPISDVAAINKENSINHSKKQKTNKTKRQINVMDILKKKSNQKKPQEQNTSINEQKSRLQKLSPSDFFIKSNSDSISIGKKNKNEIINSRSISAGGTLTLRKPSSSVKPRSVSENKLGIDLSLLFDSEEEEENDITYEKIPHDLELDLSSSENNPTKQGDLLGQLDLDLLELSENDEDKDELIDNNQNEESTYAPKIKDDHALISVVKNKKKIIPLSSASLKHVQNVSKITDESESLPNNSRYTHREVIQSRIISDIPVDFARIQELKDTPQILKKQKNFTKEQFVIQRQASFIESINSPILKKTRQQLKSVNKKSSKKTMYNFAPQSNSIMDIHEELDDVRNVSLRDASIHSPKRLKKLIMSEEIKNDAIPLDEKSKNESNVSKSPSVIINKPDAVVEPLNKSNVSFNVQELEPSTPQKNQESKAQLVEEEESMQSPIKRPIVMESPVHSEIKKFTITKPSPSKMSTEPQQEVIGDDFQDSNSDLLRSFNDNRSMLSNPKDNELLDLHKNTSADSIELINSQPDHEFPCTDITFKDVLGWNIAESTLHMARRTLFVNNLEQAASLSLKTQDIKEFSRMLPRKNVSVIENEKHFHKSLLQKYYTSQKTLIIENHQRLIQKVDDCNDLNILIKLYNKLK